MLLSLDRTFLLVLLLNSLSVIVLVFGCYLRSFGRSKAPTCGIVIGGRDKTETIVADMRSITDRNSATSREHATSFLLFGVAVFIVTYILHSVEISMGFAFGLFAVFSMLRYRTQSISVKEMTYLFLVISISLLSAVGPLTLAELLGLHAIIIASAFFWEAMLTPPPSPVLQQTVLYEKIENITPENHDTLLADLRQRTGLEILSVEIVRIDFLRDTAQLNVLFRPVASTRRASPSVDPGGKSG